VAISGLAAMPVTKLQLHQLYNSVVSMLQWADVGFPLCEGHGLPCTIRVVLKVGPNNGRRFFTCKHKKNKQCQFFQWAQGYD